MIHDDTLISEWGISEDSNEAVNNENCTHELKDETTVPENTPLTQGFQDKTVGEARNFRKTEDGIVCDLEITDGYLSRMLDEGYNLTAAPKFEGKTAKDEEIEGIRFEDAELQEVSIIVSHANPDLNENVKSEEAYYKDEK